MSTTSRGYGWRHQQERARWRPIVATGQVPCARCGKRILPGATWDLDHDRDSASGGYLGPSHAKCNRGATRRPDPDPTPRTRW